MKLTTNRASFMGICFHSFLLLNLCRWTMAGNTWRTDVHQPGYCAMYNKCGENDAGNLPCAQNRPAEIVDDTLAEAIANFCPYLWKDVDQRRLACCTVETLTATYEATLRAKDLLSGCPACWNNFLTLFCTITCSPDQAMFTDVAEIDPQSETEPPSVKRVRFAFAEAFKNSVYNACKGVKFPSSSLPVLSFMGAPTTADEFLGFLGLSYEDGGESPYSLEFLSPEDVPSTMTSYNQTLPQCGSSGYECSCADCSEADYCQPLGKKKQPSEKKHQSEKTPEESKGSSSSSSLRGYEYGILAGGFIAIIVASFFACSRWERRMYELPPFGHFSDGLSFEPMNGGSEFHAMPLIGGHPVIEQWLRNRFHAHGIFVANRPYLTIFISLLFVGLLSIGNINYRLESEPQGLWTPKSSRTVKDQERYESSFGKFYRIENLILMSNSDTPSPRLSASGKPSIITYRNMDIMFRIQDIVDNIEGSTFIYKLGKTTIIVPSGHVDNGTTSFGVKLKDVCYKPLGVCVIESVLQYWQMDRTKWEAFFSQNSPEQYDRITRQQASECIESWTTKCRSLFQAPMDPKIVLGGFPTDASFHDFVDDSTAFSVTYLLDSSEENEKAARAWEKAFLQAAQTVIKEMAAEAELDIAFSAERSTEDELDRETYMDAWTIVGSYVVMFVYIAVSLTFLTKKHSIKSENILIRSHVTLGFQGVMIVVLAVIGAFGVIGLLKMKVSMIVLEVLPFLMLAVGVDNMFIMANELRSYVPRTSLPERLGETLSKVGPSITCAAFSEAFAFGLAALAPIPAARSFSLCACIAICLGFFLQCTTFTALLVLDTIRRESNRVDCFPCIALTEPRESRETEYSTADVGTPPQERQDYIPENRLQQAITNDYIPFLLGENQKLVRCVVLWISICAFVASCILMGRMELGMEQQVAFPHDSYLQDYFTHGLPSMRVGAPVMFVVENLNVSSDSLDVNKICGISGCLPNSLVSQIDLAAEVQAYYLTSPAASWIDEFLLWFNSTNCCRRRTDTGEFCSYEDTDSRCLPCETDQSSEGIYQQYLPQFMRCVPNEQCSRGGRGVYEDYIAHAKGNASDVLGLQQQSIHASAFRSNYVQLNSQTDYIQALEETHDFIDVLKESLDLEVYAYSVFHVYFQQYLNLVPVASMMISVAIGAVFVVCCILLSSLRTSLIVMACVLMTVIDLIGASYLADVKLNGVSVVNLTMSVGIAVEFCVHLAHAFLTLSGSNSARVGTAFEDVGIAVISGIALTKFLGVTVLVFAKTKLFQVYYFRMYMALVLISAWHGFVLLPVLLALFGPLSRSIRVSSSDSNNHNNHGEEQPLFNPSDRVSENYI